MSGMSDTMQPARVPGAPSLPQVNLIPPSIRARRRVAVARVWLGLAVLVVILLTIVAAVASLWERNAAESHLADVQGRNANLLTEQAKYSEVPKVLRSLKAHHDARLLGMSTEVLWSPYLAAIASATPLEVSIDNLSVTQDTVLSGNKSAASGPLATPGTVGQVSLSGRALNLVAVSDWQKQLSSITGVTDVEVSTVQVADDNGTTYYTVGASLRLTVAAFANQFVSKE